MKLLSAVGLLLIVSSLNGNSLEEVFMDTSEITDQSAAIDEQEIDLDLDLPLADKDLTITESIQFDLPTADEIGDDYNFDRIGKEIGNELETVENAERETGGSEKLNHMRDTAITFVIETIITSVVLILLSLPYGIKGASGRFFACALVVASIGAGLSIAFFIEAAHPARFLLGLIILVPLLRWLANIRKWPHVIQISAISLVVATGLTWLASYSALTLLGL